MMKPTILALAICLISSHCFAKINKEVDSSLSWLSIIDSGNYSESWIKAAPYFQSKISKEKWESALNQVRVPLGKLISRKEIHISTHSSLPNAPIGKYKVITFSTNFKHNPLAIETVTLSEADNEWRVVGYFIK